MSAKQPGAILAGCDSISGVAGKSAIGETSPRSFLRSLGFDVHQVSCLRCHVARTVKYDSAARSDVVSYSINPL